jgi:hypothetical protein
MSSAAELLRANTANQLLSQIAKTFWRLGSGYGGLHARHDAPMESMLDQKRLALKHGLPQYSGFASQAAEDSTAQASTDVILNNGSLLNREAADDGAGVGPWSAETMPCRTGSGAFACCAGEGMGAAE